MPRALRCNGHSAAHMRMQLLEAALQDEPCGIPAAGSSTRRSAACALVHLEPDDASVNAWGGRAAASAGCTRPGSFGGFVALSLG
eukprot:4123119-Prymnesium_polylepis.1